MRGPLWERAPGAESGAREVEVARVGLVVGVEGVDRLEEADAVRVAAERERGDARVPQRILVACAETKMFRIRSSILNGSLVREI